MSESTHRILCVDDEPNVLDGLQRHLRKHFDVKIGVGSKAGLEILEQNPGFAVVVSDLRMPDMDGIEFLTRVRDLSPDTTRILLTGNADLTAAIDAVNRGNVFRFLSKPCPAADLVTAIQRAVEQHQLVTAERVLLEQTLVGIIRMLTDVLALANPTAFGRATRVKQRAGATAAVLGAPETWKMEMAAMLSQVACVTLPADTAARLYDGSTLSDADREMANRLPEVSASLLESIPRMEEVREILRHQNAVYRSGLENDGIPVGARILKLVLDLDGLESQGFASDTAIEELRGRKDAYPEKVLSALETALSADGMVQEILSIPLAELMPGMILVDPIESTDGRLIVARGQKVSVSLIERLRNFSKNITIREPVRAKVVPNQTPVAGAP